MTVTAALLELFQRDNDDLLQLVDSIQQRYDTARRRARRAAYANRRADAANP